MSKHTKIFKLDSKLAEPDLNLNLDPDPLPTGQPLLDWMEKRGIALTWDNWLRAAWGEDALTEPPEQPRGAEAFADVPEEFQADIELFLRRSTTGSIQ